MGATAGEGDRFSGPTARVTVVGIERNVRDLVSRVGTAVAGLEEHRVSAGPGLGARTAGAARFAGVAIVAMGGDVDAAEAAIEEAFSGRLYNMSINLDADDKEPISDAIRYEAGGTILFGAITALAALGFSGQAVSRQSRREWFDGPALRALGMSTRDADASAILRGAVTGSIAAVVAVGTAVALSTLGPFGMAGRAEVRTGPVVDVPVLVLGVLAVLAVVTGSTWWPVARQFRSPARRRSMTKRGGVGALGSVLPPPAAAGLCMTVNGGGAGGLPTGTAVVGVALAVAAVLGAAGLAASFETLTATPSHFGAPWDLSASDAVIEPGGSSPIAELLGEDPDVEAAAGIVGTDASIGDETSWLQAFQPVDGVAASIRPVITEGRAPAAVDEVALGSTTMADQRLSIGDSIAVQPTTSGTGDSLRLTVVGTTVVNDSFENDPGRGGVVTVEWIDRYADEVTPDPYVVRLVPGADMERFRTRLEAVASAGVNGPVRQGAIRNLDRVRWVPFLLAALIGVLALASLAHALVLSVRRQRRQLAILKSLGFRTGQVRAAVAWHASALAVAAAIIGVPLGIVAGRWGWRLVADQLGVASPPATPIVEVTAIVVGAVLLANLVAAYPAWRAAREPTGVTLRVE